MSVSICKGIACRDVDEVLSAVTAVGHYVHDCLGTVLSFDRIGVIYITLDRSCNGGAKLGDGYLDFRRGKHVLDDVNKLCRQAFV